MYLCIVQLILPHEAMSLLHFTETNIVNTAQNTAQKKVKRPVIQQLPVEQKLCTSQIRTQTASLPPSLTLNSLK